MYDIFIRNQIYCTSGNDHKTGNAAGFGTETVDTVHSLWYFDRIHLWIRWCRWWNDDAFDLTSVLGYELKTAVGTSVFIMTFTAFTGSVSHFAIGGAPDMLILFLCVMFTLLWARIAAVFANKAAPEVLNRATGIVLVVLGAAIMVFTYIIK